MEEGRKRYEEYFGKEEEGGELEEGWRSLKKRDGGEGRERDEGKGG